MGSGFTKLETKEKLKIYKRVSLKEAILQFHLLNDETRKKLYKVSRYPISRNYDKGQLSWHLMEEVNGRTGLYCDTLQVLLTQKLDNVKNSDLFMLGLSKDQYDILFQIPSSSSSSDVSSLSAV